MITSLNAFWRGTFALDVGIPTQMKPRKIRGRVTKLGLKLALAIALIFPTTAQTENPSASVGDFKNGIQPILDQHCYDCHGRKKTKGKVDLTEYASWEDFEKNPQLIEKMIEALGKNEMPPEEKKQPSDKQRKFMVLELDKAFKNAVSHGQPVIPLRLRRMNRFEYGNAVKDLFNLKSWVYSINDRIIRNHNDYFRPESGQMPKVVRVGNRIMGLQQLLENRLLGVVAFPKDPPAENGFNNRGDHLSLTPVLMESFLELSRSIVHAENFDENCRVWDEVFEDPSSTKPKTRNASIAVDKSVATQSTGLTISAWIRPSKTTDQWQTIVRREDSWRRQLLSIGRTGDTWGLWMGAGIAGRYEEFGAAVEPKTLGDGKWHHVAGSFDGKQIDLYVDGKQVGSKAIAGKLNMQNTEPMAIGSYDGNEPFHGGLNDIRLYRSGLGKLQIQSIAAGNQIVAKEEMMGSWKQRDEVRPKLKQPIEKIAHQRIENFLLRAFKSPADEKTLKLYTGYFDKQYTKSSDFTRSMKDVVSAALASPRFIFVHNATDNASPNQASFNLATRLSLFLWSSVPDDELLELAGKGRLQDIEVLNEQVERMLNHRRVKNFCDSFAPQWLKINNVVSASPDFKAHREYYFGGDDKISYKRGMHMMLEPLLNFETVFIENRPISELVDSDFTYRSHLLSEWYQGRAATYGINVNLRDIEFTRTPLSDRRFGGVITTGAVMVMTSSPSRSLPITRGAWVSSVIFNDPPEPPPDDIPDLKADDETLKREGLTVRQKLKQHSSDTQCASCHKKIDPLGFVLENYDLLGRWRDDYRTGLKVDASGKLFGKHKFKDVVGFKEAILAEEEVFTKAFVGHLLSYALGRELTFADRVAIGEIAEASKKDHYRMRAVIKNIAVHSIFTQIKNQ
ncbi:MAG: mono/diheme cytochrome c family protein [Verrucomicrobiales bacterium]|jgi:mono/diheme cytochrome c family protein